MLVLLRLSIGWHFYTEGLDKYQAGNWSAAPFFANAKGPFAQQYRNLVWDADGSLRLDKEATMIAWATFRDRIAAHYGFDDQQKRQAQANYAKAVEQYEWVLEQNVTELEEYDLGRERVLRFETNTEEKNLRDGVASLGGQRDTIRKEWQQKAAPALKQIDTIWKNYAIAQNATASTDQVDQHGAFALSKPRRVAMDTSVIDPLVPYFDMTVGLCLLLGLFTPVVALAAAGFLGSVFLSQYPPATGPASSNYQLIECMACLVLAGTGAGRFAGLDFFLHMIIRKVWGHPAQED
tara:strand:+ start:33245 stop:34123 length:879 start_codon:yes stop_codon:yes gene_type:complete